MSAPSVGARYCVLDVETAMSEGAAALAAGGERPNIARVALHELVGGSALLFERRDDGTFGAMRQISVGAGGEDECAMLCELHGVLAEAHRAGAFLVTFNGCHDLSVLRRRAARHWLFNELVYEAWPAEAAGRHLDMMREDPLSVGGRWPNLVDAAAGYGINAVCATPVVSSRNVCRPVRKAEVDTVTTALLLFHHLAMAERSLSPLVQGWSALSDWLIANRHLDDHLRQFARHPFAAVARRLARSG